MKTGQNSFVRQCCRRRRRKKELLCLLLEWKKEEEKRPCVGKFVLAAAVAATTTGRYRDERRRPTRVESITWLHRWQWRWYTNGLPGRALWENLGCCWHTYTQGEKNLRTTHKKTFIRGNGRKTQTAEEKKKYISGKASSSFEAETRFHLILEAGNSYKLTNEKKGGRQRERKNCRVTVTSVPRPFTDKCFESFSSPSSFASNLNDSHSFCFLKKPPKLTCQLWKKSSTCKYYDIFGRTCVGEGGSVIQIAIQRVVTNMGIYSAFFLQLRGVFLLEHISVFFLHLWQMVMNVPYPLHSFSQRKRRIYVSYLRHGSFRPMHVQSSTVGWLGVLNPFPRSKALIRDTTTHSTVYYIYLRLRGNQGSTTFTAV